MTATDKMAAWMNLPSLDAMLLMRPQARMAEALLRQNIEILGFVKDRMERDRALLAELSTLRDPAAALNLWSEFWQHALSDYTAETTKLAKSVGEIAEQAMRNAGEETAALAKVATGKVG